MHISLYRFVLFVAFFAHAISTEAFASEKIRLGWQTPWATQGQLVSILQKTNLPQMLDLDISFIGFSYGAPLNRAALAGQVDLLLTADQPAAALIAKNSGFKIVGRMMYNRTCVYTHPLSPLNKVSAIGKGPLLGPSGAAAERIALKLIANAGGDPGVELGDLDMAGQSALIKGSIDGTWRGTKALYGFDPLPAVWEQSGKIKMLGCGKAVSFIVASKDFIEQHPVALEKFLKAFSLAWMYYATKPALANGWFKELSGLDVPDRALETAAAVEPNIHAKHIAEVSLDVSSEDQVVFKEAVTFLQQRGQVGSEFSVPAAFDLTTYQKVKGKLPELQEIYSRIKVVP